MALCARPSPRTCGPSSESQILSRVEGVRRPAFIVAASLLAVYVVGLALLVLSPTRLDGDGMVVYRTLYDLHDAGLPRWIGYRVVESAANVAVMMPLGALTALLLPRRLWWVAVLACCGLSLSIEAAQALLPGRMPSVIDLVANSAGALLGAALTLPFRRLTPEERATRDL